MKSTRGLKIYLDTSIYNFAVTEQDVERERESTLRLLEQMKAGRFEGFISEVVLREINMAPEPKRKVLLEVVKGVPLEELFLTHEVEALADKYVTEGIIPERYRDDALHIAVASVYNMDVVVSWNFEHMVKVKTRRDVQGINTMMGYRNVDIATPEEVIFDEGT